MPKLLIINVTCNQGSTGKISEQVGLMMKEQKWNVYYAHGARRVNPSKLNTIPFSSVKEEYLHAFISLLFDADGLGSNHATKKLLTKIKKIKPDVIHIHNIHGYYLNYKILFNYLNKTNIPIVLTLHDCWNFTGHCTHFVTANCDKWKEECFECPLLKVSPKSYIDQTKRNYTLKKTLLTANKKLYIVAVSAWLGKQLNDSFLKNKNIRIIKNGIDLNIFKPHQKKSKEKFKILGVTNVWSKDKGIFDILKLNNMLVTSEYEITLVGLIPTSIKKQLPDNITTINNIEKPEELACLYAEADVLINPTYADTFPTVNLESLACGTPVITYRTGGSPESLTAETGIIIDQGDVNSMANAIKKLRITPLDREACRRHAELHFDQNECFLAYSKLFKDITSINYK